MKKNHKKGFTLIELLAAITILGIIAIIALPQINNLQNENQKTKYITYANSVLTSGKLYTDSYAEDMFGNNTSGCYDIPYTALKNKDLVKDIKVNGAVCETYEGQTELTFVRVLKSNDHYIYDISIKCVDQNGKELYSDTLKISECDGLQPDRIGPNITLSPNGMNWTTGQGKTTTISISDDYGMLENAKIKYAWTTNPNSVNDSDYKTYSFQNKRYEGTTDNPLKLTIDIPQGKTGLYYLIVRPESVRDANGNYQTDTVKSNAFKLDNEKPTVAKITNSSNAVWTNSNVNISVIAADNSDEIKQIYYSYSKTGTLYNDWTTNNTKSVTGTWTAERNQEVFIIVEDSVGNKSEPVSAGRVQIDKTKPIIQFNLAPGTHNNSSGISVTSTCTDSASGVDTQTGATSVQSPTQNKTVTHYCIDKAGNSSSISGTYNVRQYSANSSCGVNQYNSCRNESCGIESYKSCAHSDCGVETYKSCSHFDCGYNSCATSDCGIASYNSCTHSECGVYQYKSCHVGYSCSSGWSLSGAYCYRTYTQSASTSCLSGYINFSGTCYKQYSPSACETNCGGGSGICGYMGDSIAWCLAETGKVIYSCPSGYTLSGTSCSYTESKSATAVYNRVSSCGIESYNTCRTLGCGIESYKICEDDACGTKTCRTSSCGVETYKTCATSGCGVNQYKSCRNQSCGVESYKECWHF